jgi:hypothetical protein
MIEMKYVVVESTEQGKQLFIFPKNIDHDRMAETLSFIRHGGQTWNRIFRTPISAGFTDGITCYGRSETLVLDSQPGDTLMLKTLNGNQNENY